MSVEEPAENRALTPHHLSWADFDALARGDGGPAVVRRLRRAERSRRLLLLRALADEVMKTPELAGPLPSPEEAWELLARVQQKSPRVLDSMLAHPYTGAWVGYSTRLLHSQITGVCPLWMHMGHLHAIAAAAAIRAGLDFSARIPLWHGHASLPSIGMARLPADAPWSVAEVSASNGQVLVSTGAERTSLPSDHTADGPGWWGMRRLTARSGGQVLSLCLDDLDPYRGLYEPVVPQRLGPGEADIWRGLLDSAWQLIVDHVPGMASVLRVGLDSLVPSPAVPFGSWSASTGEAFGSAVVARPSDATSLAATLVHEFQHSRLSGLLHLTRLHAADERERFYTPWRDDPRPIAGTLHGVYAFFGVTMFWRALAKARTTDQRAQFEFAYWRAATWRTLRTLSADTRLTPTGQRFISGVAERLGPWQDERVPEKAASLAAAMAADHHAGWRMRHVRPSRHVVDTFTDAWRHGRNPPADVLGDFADAPTPVPDGSWTNARATLVRMSLSNPDRELTPEQLTIVPEATVADIAYARGQYTRAAQGYLTELAQDPDRPTSWTGLGIALSAAKSNSAAARVLLRCPELVRAVHRNTRPTAPDELASWMAHFVR